jgi:hypothetical protein
MTYRRSQIITPGWLLHARPVQVTCAHQVSARPQTTNPPSPAGSAWQLTWKECIGSHAQKAKRPDETIVASTVSALYP